MAAGSTRRGQFLRVYMIISGMNAATMPSLTSTRSLKAAPPMTPSTTLWVIESVGPSMAWTLA
jgi:hypothetical protein